MNTYMQICTNQVTFGHVDIGQEGRTEIDLRQMSSERVSSEDEVHELVEPSEGPTLDVGDTVLVQPQVAQVVQTIKHGDCHLRETILS